MDLYEPPREREHSRRLAWQVLEILGDQRIPYGAPESLAGAAYFAGIPDLTRIQTQTRLD